MQLLITVQLPLITCKDTCNSEIYLSLCISVFRVKGYISVSGMIGSLVCFRPLLLLFFHRMAKFVSRPHQRRVLRPPTHWGPLLALVPGTFNICLLRRLSTASPILKRNINLINSSGPIGTTLIYTTNKFGHGSGC